MWYFQEISFLFSQNIPLKVITMFMDSAVILYSFAQSFPIFLTFVEFLREFLSTQNSSKETDHWHPGRRIAFQQKRGCFLKPLHQTSTATH